MGVNGLIFFEREVIPDASHEFIVEALQAHNVG